MGKLKASLLVVLLACQGVASEMDDLKAAWEDTGMSMSFLQKKINNTNCYLTEAKFLGCVKGLNAMLGMIANAKEGSRPLMLSNPEHIKALGRMSRAAKVEETSFTVEKDFGGAQVYAGQVAKESVEDDVVPASRESLLNANRRSQRMQNTWKESWLKVYASHNPTEQLDFAAALNWIEPLLPEKSAYIFGTALNIYIQNGEDAHGTLVPEKPYRDNMAKNSENFVGIGVELRQLPGTKKLVVVNVFDGMPAQKAGIMPNDVLAGIEGIDVSAFSLDKVVPMIRGPEGTKVNISVSRNSSLMKFSVERKAVNIMNVTSSKLPIMPNSKAKAGYIKIRGFDKPSVCEDVSDAVTTLIQDKNVKGIVVDVRDNPGGILSETACIFGLFMGRGQLVLVQDPIKKELNPDAPLRLKLPKPQPLYTKNDQLTDLPMAIIINPRSASASEVLSGALQGHGRAVVVGERSWGKGTVLTVGAYESAEAQTGRLANLLGIPEEQLGAKSDEPSVHGLIQIQTESMFFLPPAVGDVFHTNQLVGIAPDIEAYIVPHPSKIHKFALREKDVLPISLSSPETDSPPRNPQVKHRIEMCMKSWGSAEKRYVSGDPSVGKDYQLLVSLDSLACEIKTR